MASAPLIFAIRHKGDQLRAAERLPNLILVRFWTHIGNRSAAKRFVNPANYREDTATRLSLLRY